MHHVFHLLRRFLKQQGIDVNRAAPGLLEFINARQITTVIDVGANIGQFGKSLRNKGYKGKIISFEPLPAEFQKLSGLARADGNWEAHNFALGATSGESVINVSQFSVFSSMKAINHTALKFDSRANVVRSEKIIVRTMDETFPTLPSNTLLKVDTQGFEKQVLEGASRILPEMKGVILELPIVRLYDDTWHFHEAAEFMSSLGFVPAQIEPVSFLTNDPVSLVEVDCLFRPRHSGLPSG